MYKQKEIRIKTRDLESSDPPALRKEYQSAQKCICHSEVPLTLLSFTAHFLAPLLLEAHYVFFISCASTERIEKRDRKIPNCEHPQFELSSSIHDLSQN